MFCVFKPERNPVVGGTVELEIDGCVMLELYNISERIKLTLIINFVSH